MAAYVSETKPLYHKLKLFSMNINQVSMRQNDFFYWSTDEKFRVGLYAGPCKKIHFKGQNRG